MILRFLPQFLFVAALLAMAWEGLRWFARLNIYQPSREPSGVLPAAFGLKAVHEKLRASDGTPIDACWIPEASYRAEPRGPFRHGPLADSGFAVLFCHGNAGNLTDRYVKAAILSRLGLGVLLFDYRGYGKSGGKPTEAGTYQDGEAAWSCLTEKLGVPADRIVLYGESLGNGVAIELARRHRARAIILESAFTSAVDMGRKYFPWLPVALILRDRYDNLSKIPEIRSPVLSLHSPEDEIVPYSMGRRLFEAAPSPKRFVDLRGDHNDGYIDAGAAYPDAVEAFLESVLRRGAST